MEKRGLFHGVENTHAILPASVRMGEVVSRVVVASTQKLDSGHNGVSKVDLFATPSKPGSKRPALSMLNANIGYPTTGPNQPTAPLMGHQKVSGFSLPQHLRPTGSALLTGGAKRVVVFQSPQHPTDTQETMNVVSQHPVAHTPTSKVHEKNHYMKPTEAFK